MSKSASINTSDIQVFDRQTLRQARRRSAKNTREHMFLFDWAEAQIAERLLDVNRDFETALQIGMRNDGAALLKTGKIKTLHTTDIIVEGAAAPSVVSDEEFLPFKPAAFDLIISALNLHSVNDLPGALLQIRQSLKPDGLFVAAILGGETLHELRECLMQSELALKDGVSPRVFPFADKQQAGGLLQRAGFALPVIDRDACRVKYKSLKTLIEDLRDIGETNILSAYTPRYAGRQFLEEITENYLERDGRGKYSVLLDILWMTGWAPHPAQPKPLKPGSAKTRLSDALGVKEGKL
mgnify:CR=1 FL=1